MFKKILIGLVLVVAAVLAAAAFQPDEFRVERSIVIAAPADKIFPQVNNLKNFNLWSPWAKLDPDAKGVFEGPEEGVDSKFSWEGNRNVGQGSMTNIETQPNALVRFRMDFVKPMKGTDTSDFTFAPEGDGTKVTWALYGKKAYLCKLVGMVVSTDKMVGDQFEKGLNNLKALVEQPEKAE